MAILLPKDSMMMRSFAMLFVATVSTLVVSAIEAEGQPKDSPQSQVLSRYIGEWDDVYTSEKPAFSKGKFTAYWVLNGEFVEVNGDLTAARAPEDITIKKLITFDRKENVYRRWTFVSNGNVLEDFGTWDEGSRTMTWASKDDHGPSGTEIAHTTAETFNHEGMQEWTTVAKKPNDIVIHKSHGKRTRRQR